MKERWAKHETNARRRFHREMPIGSAVWLALEYRGPTRARVAGPLSTLVCTTRATTEQPWVSHVTMDLVRVEIAGEVERVSIARCFKTEAEARRCAANPFGR